MSNIEMTTEDFDVKRIFINTDRFINPVTITNLVTEVNMYESIYMPYLTGNMTFIDTNNMLNSAQFSGTERVTFEFSAAFDDSTPIVKTFIISSIDSIVQDDDNNRTVFCSLVEDVYMLNESIAVSKMYDGKGERIIEKILKDKLNKNLYKGVKTYKESYQGLFRILSPYLKPFDLIKMALYKMTTENGSPYFLYSTIYSDDLVLSDLDTMLSQSLSSPIISDTFRYSQSQSNNPTNNFRASAAAIYDVQLTNQENTIKLLNSGALGAEYNITDIYGNKGTTYYSARDLYNKLISAGVISIGSDQKLYDNLFVPDASGQDDRKLDEHISKRFNEIAGPTHPFDDRVDNWTWESDPFSYNLRMNKAALIQLLNKNQYQILVPGFYFLLNNSSQLTSVGNRINMEFFVNEKIDEPDNATVSKNNKMSGEFLITNKRHIFNMGDLNKHTVSLVVSRIADERSYK